MKPRHKKSGYQEDEQMYTIKRLVELAAENPLETTKDAVGAIFLCVIIFGLLMLSIIF